jgi:hypothetical protein
MAAAFELLRSSSVAADNSAVITVLAKPDIVTISHFFLIIIPALV